MKIAKSFMKAFKWNEWNFNGEKSTYMHFCTLIPYIFPVPNETFFDFNLNLIKHGGAWNHNFQITASGVRTSV